MGNILGWPSLILISAHKCCQLIHLRSSELIVTLASHLEISPHESVQLDR
jgi:hypothetical protein